MRCINKTVVPTWWDCGGFFLFCFLDLLNFADSHLVKTEDLVIDCLKLFNRKTGELPLTFDLLWVVYTWFLANKKPSCHLHPVYFPRGTCDATFQSRPFQNSSARLATLRKTFLKCPLHSVVYYWSPHATTMTRITWLHSELLKNDIGKQSLMCWILNPIRRLRQDWLNLLYDRRLHQAS